MWIVCTLNTTLPPIAEKQRRKNESKHWWFKRLIEYAVASSAYLLTFSGFHLQSILIIFHSINNFSGFKLRFGGCHRKELNSCTYGLIQQVRIVNFKFVKRKVNISVPFARLVFIYLVSYLQWCFYFPFERFTW